MIGSEAITGSDQFARSTTIPDELFRLLSEGKITARDFAVACALEKFAFGDKRRCEPSVQTVATLTALSDRSVQYALDALESAGFICRVVGNGRGYTTEYTLTGHKFGPSKGTNGHLKGETGFTHSPGKGAKSGAKGCKTAQERVQPVAPESTNESTNESLLSASETKATNSERLTANEFEEFWKVYPRKVAKKSAFKTWERLHLSPEEIAKILADVAKQAKTHDWTKESGRFIPYPATYLNGERWNDEGIQNGHDQKTTEDAKRASDERLRQRFASTAV